ncbi:MAG: hypothetical protein K6G56_04200 [Clostridiales bacterium]|nr:hypothetical protein [Clostridiales bacterium]
MNESKKLLLIANPAAGMRGVEQSLPAVKEIFREGGFEVSVFMTGAPGDAEDIAFREAPSHDLIVCAGGDGTLYQIINGMIRSGSNVPVGYIPCGSTNEFAAAHGIPRIKTEAAKRILEGGEIKVDVGIFGERYFVGTAAFGAFSWMGYSTDQSKKNRLGYTAYIIEGIRGLKRNRPHHLRITADGKLYEGDFIFGAVCATRELSKRIHPKKEKGAEEQPPLELLLVNEVKSLSDGGSIVKSLSTGTYEHSALTFVRAREILIENEEGLIWSIGGESSGEFITANIGVLRGGLTIRGAKK